MFYTFQIFFGTLEVDPARVSLNFDNLSVFENRYLGISNYFSVICNTVHSSMATSMATACLTPQFCYVGPEYFRKTSKIGDINLHPLTSSQKYIHISLIISMSEIFGFLSKRQIRLFCFLCFSNNLELIFILSYMKLQK